MTKRATIAAAVTAALLSGCASKRDAEFEKNYLRFQIPKEAKKAIETIYVDELVEVSDNLSHDALARERVSVRIEKGTPISRLGEYLNYPVRADFDVADRKMPRLTFEGDVRDFLDKIAAYTGTYWHYENGAIVFKRTKTLYYSVAALTPDRLGAVYNVGDNGNSPYPMEKIKNSIYDEIEKALAAIYSEGRVVGSVKFEERIEKGRKNERTSETLSKNEKEFGHVSESQRLTLEQTSESEEGNKVSYEKGSRKKTSESENGVESKKPRRSRSKNGGDEVRILPVLKESEKNKNESVKNSENSSVKNSSKKSSGSSSDTKKRSSKTTVAKNFQSKGNSASVSEDKRTITSSLAKLYGYKDAMPFAVSKSTGIIATVVTRESESRVDGLIRAIVERYLSNVVDLSVYVLEVNSKNLRSFGAQLKGHYERRHFDSDLSTDPADPKFNVTIDSLMHLAGLRKYSLDSVVKFLLQKNSGKILQRAHLLMLPSIPSRIRATIDYPYLEPQQISVGGTNSQLSYQIKYVSDGLDMGVNSLVYGDTVVMSIGMSLNQYLGKESVQAGQLGVFDLPLQSPRTLNTTMRVRAGDVFLLGGLRKALLRKANSSNLLVPDKIEKELSKSEIVIVAEPKILRFRERPKPSGFYIGKATSKDKR